MERILGRYAKIMKATEYLETIGEIEYRYNGVDGSRIYAVDRDSGIVLKTDFLEIEDLRPVSLGGKRYPSDGHQDVVAMMTECQMLDVDEALDAVSESKHP
jgi:hypothetical protein